MSFAPNGVRSVLILKWQTCVVCGSDLHWSLDVVASGYAIIVLIGIMQVMAIVDHGEQTTLMQDLIVALVMHIICAPRHMFAQSNSHTKTNQCHKYTTTQTLLLLLVSVLQLMQSGVLMTLHHSTQSLHNKLNNISSPYHICILMYTPVVKVVQYRYNIIQSAIIKHVYDPPYCHVYLYP